MSAGLPALVAARCSSSTSRCGSRMPLLSLPSSMHLRELWRVCNSGPGHEWCCADTVVTFTCSTVIVAAFSLTDAFQHLIRIGLCPCFSFFFTLEAIL